MEWKSRAHPISDVRDWSRNNRLELQPDFQRNVVWSRAAQIALIDTIFLDIPIPKIYIKSIIKEEQTYRVVVDGQQRLTAILDFVENRLRLRAPYFSQEEYVGKKFSELPENIRNEVLAYNIDFNEIVNPTDEELRDLYARVNKYTVQLNKQELRRADFPGEFLALAEELANLEFFNDAKLFSTGQKRRMLDVEFIEELLCLQLEGEQDKKETIDDFCERYAKFDEDDAEEHSKTKTQVKSNFENVLADITLIFQDEISLAGTRFKQKADFYSLFACIWDYVQSSKTLNPENLSRVRASLLMLNKEIEPHSENETYSDYAIRCISDANSIASRRWRKKFLNDYIAPLYLTEDELEEQSRDDLQE